MDPKIFPIDFGIGLVARLHNKCLCCVQVGFDGWDEGSKEERLRA
jgi:hypothetical protein